MTTKKSPHVTGGSYLDTCRWTAPYICLGFLIRILGDLFELVVVVYISGRKEYLKKHSIVSLKIIFIGTQYT